MSIIAQAEVLSALQKREVQIIKMKKQGQGKDKIDVEVDLEGIAIIDF